MAIPQSFIQELLARADVVDIVGRHVQLKKSGGNFTGLCPFHAEKSPSFTVSPAKQFYHCFGCGKNGDAISFLMEHTGATFVDAVHDLAQQYGLQVPEDDASPQDKAMAAERRQKQSTLSDTLEKAAAAYRKHLKNSSRAIDYLKSRGLSGEIAKRFGLGYAPEGWRSLASVFPDYDDALLVESGLVIAKESEDNKDEAGPSTSSGLGKRYDRFRDRIMFPIRNVKGECIGFGGRVLGDEKPKYLNSPETPVFSKGLELYGLYEARSAIRDMGYVLVTEGYMDVVALAQLGFANAVATLGTACTSEHVKKLFRHTDSVVFSFDGDEAGRRASRRALEAVLPFATDTRTIKFLFLPTEPRKHDPDSYIREYGPEAFTRQISEAVPLSRFLIDSAREGCDLATAEGRARFTSQARPLWSALPDSADGSTLRRQLLGEIASLVQLDAAELSGLWAAHRGPVAPKKQESPAPRPASRTRAIRQVPQLGDDQAVRLLLAHSGLWEQLSQADHELLRARPGLHGELLGWLESRLLDHGPEAWGGLRQALQTLQEHSELAALAEKLMNSDLAPTDNPEDAVEEMHNLLRAMRRERLMAELTPDLATRDPERYRELQKILLAV